MDTTTIERPTLALATRDGKAARGKPRTVKPLTERQGEEELIAFLGDLRSRLDPTAELWVEAAILLAEAEQRQARRRPAS